MLIGTFWSNEGGGAGTGTQGSSSQPSSAIHPLISLGVV